MHYNQRMKALRWYGIIVISLTILGLFADFFDDIEPGNSITAIALYTPILIYLISDHNLHSKTKDTNVHK